jgi:branched-chain amino acid aminotransferase
VVWVHTKLAREYFNLIVVISKSIFFHRNYGPTIYVNQMAQAKGCQQVLWLHGDERYITEVGTMNVFMYLKNKKGETELVTPPLNGLILPGVTRQSILDLGRTWVNIF